ncbi:unnamed protein product [Candida verbasci]|uniref:Zn(2)-C6 fungal-type domain-containing protein n=1 Tax=Candida verbasci TaxID=1227364 RepID=A0A9W4TSX0_9ASCO|nr:unnamed protein product [Candida verbasci]
MFVFPAFDSNYQSRKRTFKCCENCRNKKTKCDITSVNYETKGCQNCIKHDLTCSLIKQKPNKQSKNTKNTQKQQQVNYGLLPTFDTPIDMTTITNQYLHDTFGFNISSHNDLTFHFVAHDDPKVIVSDQDIKNYQGQGILLQNNKEKDINSIKNSKVYHLKNENHYKFLLSIDAFTLSSSEFQFSKNDELELIKLYFIKINSILPIIHEKLFWDDYFKQEAISMYIYAIVLVISRDKLSKPLLEKVFKTSNDHQYFKKLSILMESLEFKIRQILLISGQLGDEDKLMRIGLHLLLGLHFNFDKWGNEQSVHDLNNAVDLSTGIGIHLKRCPQINVELYNYTSNLWWCCYILDKFSGLVNCRPFFIKSEDFNVDLPYDDLNLLKMVQLARNIENVIILLFRPYSQNSIESQSIRFDIDKFQNIEFELCEKERSSNQNQQTQVYSMNEIGSNQYVFENIHFLSRIVNNVLIMKSQKKKFENSNIPKYIPESIAVRAGSNILFYMNQIPDNFMLNIPLIPLCMSLSMAIALKQTARLLVDNKVHTFSESEIYRDELKFEDYILKLEQFAPYWWIVDEICKVTRVFLKNLEKKNNRKKRKLMNQNQNQNQSMVDKRRKDNDSQQYRNITNQNNTVILENPQPQQNAMHVQYLNLDKTRNSNLDSLESYEQVQQQQQRPIIFSSSVESFSDNQQQFDQYFESMQMDMFNDEFFLDLKNVMDR